MPKYHAQAILDRYWNGNLPIDILSIAEMMGLSVRYLPDSESNLAGKYENGTLPTCYINRNEPTYRQRFTLAHEIGHHALNHGNAFRDTDSSMYSYDPKEHEANIFAANLLMPDHIVESVIKNAGIDNVYDLADAFAVSPTAMNIKLKSLGYY